MLGRLSKLKAIAAALNSRADKPNGWQFAPSLEGRQTDADKRGWLLMGETDVAEDNPNKGDTRQRNLVDTTSELDTKIEITLNAKTAEAAEAAVDYLWVAVPALSEHNSILRIDKIESSMRVYEENALRKAAVHITHTQLFATGGETL